MGGSVDSKRLMNHTRTAPCHNEMKAEAIALLQAFGPLRLSGSQLI